MRNQANKKVAKLRSNHASFAAVRVGGPSNAESGYVTVPPAGVASDSEVEIDWVKVEMLRGAIERGSYEVDPFALAEAMIDRARRAP